MPPNLLEASAGLLLVLFLPGFALTRALFPERRVFRPLSLRTAVEQLASSVVLSVVLAIVVPFAWLGSASGVEADWTDPLIEVSLSAVAVAGLAVAVVRGSFSRTVPAAPPEERVPGEDDPMGLLRRLEANAREERRIRHRIRVAPSGSPEGQRLKDDLDRVRAEGESLRREREAEYAG